MSLYDTVVYSRGSAENLRLVLVFIRVLRTSVYDHGPMRGSSLLLLTRTSSTQTPRTVGTRWQFR